ncbi:hypothetical protein ABLE93_03775 [Xanthobacter sp. KR7-65]|uniref:hypothetical protein n=1 Tax=Xanthobacter sp. KR7-65 TaxID=3156612 RepID=UPI0032B4FA96
MFGFHLPSWGALRRPLPFAALHVVARAVPVAPCGWVFFDGSVTRVETDDGAGLIIPGGAFFPREARCFATIAEAEAEAARLNEAGLCLDRPWRVKPVSAFRPQRERLRHATAAL